LALVVLLPSCSINRWAVNKAADLLSSGGGEAFTGDSDPELVAEALPFALKMYESLLESAPNHPQLLLTTGSGFIMYANAFVHTPADMLPDDEYEQKERLLARARNLYLRGRDYVLRALTLRHPGLADFLAMDPARPAGALAASDEALQDMKTEDVPYLFWAGAGWMAAFSTSPFDMRLALTRNRGLALLQRALELDEGFQQGALHEFFVSYYGSLPASAGGSEEKARDHFRRALELSGGKAASVYVALATSVAVNRQDPVEFQDLLDRALAIDPAETPENRLANVINQRKARWLLDHIEDYFLIDSQPLQP
jgi:predicted anti-sigma-YlaC factor YlaD